MRPAKAGASRPAEERKRDVSRASPKNVNPPIPQHYVHV
jgi:hypothetical protein